MKESSEFAAADHADVLAVIYMGLRDGIEEGADTSTEPRFSLDEVDAAAVSCQMDRCLDARQSTANNSDLWRSIAIRMCRRNPLRCFDRTGGECTRERT